MEPQAAFGLRLSRLRLKAGFTQPQFAEKAGINLNNLKNWEQGRTQPGILVALPLAKALGVELDVLLDITAELAEPTPPRMGRPRKKEPTG